MNYLAHIYLSGTDEQLTLGNFIGDAVKGKRYLDYPIRMQQGILLHRAIDSYTDTHPMVKQSVHRLFDEYRWYSGVIVDMYYDHFLAKNWTQFHKTALTPYTLSFYTLLQKHYVSLPKRVQNFLPYMIEENWLLKYATLDGLSDILSQMNRRTLYKSKMDRSIGNLQDQYQKFETEFYSFFADLERFSTSQITLL